jgi:hypothetical protein
MCLDAVDPSLLRRGHIRIRDAPGPDQPEQRGCRLTADRGPLAACEHGRHVGRLHARRRVTDAVHAPIHADQASFVESFRDPAAGRARIEQLPSRDDAVLARGYRSNDPV